jgi:hypothetical protein
LSNFGSEVLRANKMGPPTKEIQELHKIIRQEVEKEL